MAVLTQIITCVLSFDSIYTYLPFSATQHKTRCVCGYSAKNDHIFNIDGYCEACLYHGGIL